MTPIARPAEPPVVRVNKRPLDESYIVDVSMELLREAGVENFSMRNLSKRLGVAVGAVYRHVSGRHDLLVMCLARVFAEVDRPRDPAEDPRVFVRDLIVRIIDTLDGYAGLSPWAAANAQLDSFDVTPSVIDALVTAGMDEEEARRTMDVLFFFVSGALTINYRDVMERLGVADYRDNLRKDIDHILTPRVRPVAPPKPAARRRAPRRAAD
jgi:AcrR family transcriptional regulator